MDGGLDEINAKLTTKPELNFIQKFVIQTLPQYISFGLTVFFIHT